MKYRSAQLLLTAVALGVILACAPSRLESEVPTVPIGPNYLSPRDTMVPLYSEWKSPSTYGRNDQLDTYLYQQSVSAYYQTKATERCAEALERIALVLEKGQGGGGTEK
ncbi:MAG: hypothetical protein Q8P59_06385 [Dehalococcoidia bacterium]|nr:hypothetical protein [Dehalococcoidia bacterium]